MKLFKIIFIFTIFNLFPFFANAGEITFRAKGDEFLIGESFTVEVYIDTQDANINAVEGDIYFPSKIIKILDVDTGGSAINFWIVEPKDTKDRMIHFAGMTPGGFTGDSFKLFSIRFQGKAPGVGEIYGEKIRTLINDGYGTEVDTKIKKMTIAIPEKKFDFFSFGDFDRDDEPPEDFTPFIANDPSIFEGRAFLIFLTHDKGSGVDHYEVKEGDWGVFKNAQSPYLLTYQSLNIPIYVKAVDKNGNERIVRVSPKNPPQNDEDIFGKLIFIFIFALFFTILIFRKKFQNKKNKRVVKRRKK